MSIVLEHVDKPVNAGGKKASSQTCHVAQYVIEQLSAWGVKRIYGVLGDTYLHFLDSLAKDGRIQFVAAAHEGAAALMASGEAKLTGRVAVCMATSGPGIANLMNGLGDADMDGASVLAITGQVETSKIGTKTKQYIDQQRLVEPLAGRTHLLTHPSALSEILLDCLTYSSIQGGVSHLSVPKDLWKKELSAKVHPYPSHLHQTMIASESDIQQASAMLSAADRPVLLIGRGVEHAREQVVQLAEQLQAAVVTTLPARPYFPNDHELYVGGFGQAGSEASSLLLAEADVIAILGATWWPDEYAPSTAKTKVIQVDAVAANIGMGHSVDQGVVGDLGQIVPMLLKQTSGVGQRDRSSWQKRVRVVAGAWKQRIEAEAADEGTPIKPQRLMRAISRAAAEDAVIAVDTGDHTLWFNRIFQAKPQQRILVSGRWRTLGFALPAAIAAQAEHPHRQVIALAGDGGVLQTIMELGTAVRCGLPVVLIVCSNGSYAMEKHRMTLGGLEPLGSRLENPDFAAIARACGGAGYQADTVDQLEQCLRQALAERRPAIVNVSIDDTVVPHTHM
jgi:pyruvate oxidase